MNRLCRDTAGNTFSLSCPVFWRTIGNVCFNAKIWLEVVSHYGVVKMTLLKALASCLNLL